MSSKDHEQILDCFICGEPTTNKPNGSTFRSRAVFSHDAMNARQVEEWFQKNDGYRFKSFRPYNWSVPVCSGCYLRVSRESMKNPPASPTRNSTTIKTPADYLAGISGRYNSSELEELKILLSDTSDRLASTLPDVQGSDPSALQFYISDFVEFIKVTKVVYPDWVIKWIIPVHLIWINDMNEIIPDKLKNIPSFAQLAKMLVPAILDRFSNESVKAAEKAREDAEAEGDESYNKEGYNRIHLLKDVSVEEYFLSARLVDFLLHGLRRENSITSDEYSDIEQLLNTLLVCIEGFERLKGNFVGTLGIFEARPWAIDCLIQLAIDQTSNFGPTCLRILETLTEATRVFNLPNLQRSIDEAFEKRLSKIAVIIGNLRGQDLKVFEFVIPLVNLICFVRQIDRSSEMVLFLRSSLNVVYDSLPDFIKFPTHDKHAIRSEIISAAPNTICSKVESMLSIIEKMRGDIGSEYSVSEAIRRIRTRFSQLEVIRTETVLDINTPNLLHLEENALFGNPEDEKEFYAFIKDFEEHPLLKDWKPSYSKHVSTWYSDNLIQLESSGLPIDTIMDMPTDELDKLVGDLIAECKDTRTKNLPKHFLMEATANIERSLRSFPEIDPDYIKYIPQAADTNPALMRKNPPPPLKTTKDVRNSELRPARPLWDTTDPRHPIHHHRIELDRLAHGPVTTLPGSYLSEGHVDKKLASERRVDEEHAGKKPVGESEKSPTTSEGKTGIINKFLGFLSK